MANKIITIGDLNKLVSSKGYIGRTFSGLTTLCPTYSLLTSTIFDPTKCLSVTGYSVGDSGTGYSSSQEVCEKDVTVTATITATPVSYIVEGRFITWKLSADTTTNLAAGINGTRRVPGSGSFYYTTRNVSAMTDGSTVYDAWSTASTQAAATYITNTYTPSSAITVTPNTSLVAEKTYTINLVQTLSDATLGGTISRWETAVPDNNYTAYFIQAKNAVKESWDEYKFGAWRVTGDTTYEIDPTYSGTRTVAADANADSFTYYTRKNISYTAGNTATTSWSTSTTIAPMSAVTTTYSPTAVTFTQNTGTTAITKTVSVSQSVITEWASKTWIDVSPTSNSYNIIYTQDPTEKTANYTLSTKIGPFTQNNMTIDGEIVTPTINNGVASATYTLTTVDPPSYVSGTLYPTYVQSSAQTYAQLSDYGWYISESTTKVISTQFGILKHGYQRDGYAIIPKNTIKNISYELADKWTYYPTKVLGKPSGVTVDNEILTENGNYTFTAAEDSKGGEITIGYYSQSNSGCTGAPLGTQVVFVYGKSSAYSVGISASTTEWNHLESGSSYASTVVAWKKVNGVITYLDKSYVTYETTEKIFTTGSTTACGVNCYTVYPNVYDAYTARTITFTVSAVLDDGKTYKDSITLTQDEAYSALFTTTTSVTSTYPTVINSFLNITYAKDGNAYTSIVANTNVNGGIVKIYFAETLEIDSVYEGYELIVSNFGKTHKVVDGYSSEVLLNKVIVINTTYSGYYDISSRYPSSVTTSTTFTTMPIDLTVS